MLPQVYQPPGTGVEAWHNTRPIRPLYKPWASPGGVEYNDMTFKKDTLRAELVELTNNYSLAQSTKIVDAILAKYAVKRRPLNSKEPTP
jgi:hypothetical protein